MKKIIYTTLFLLGILARFEAKAQYVMIQDAAGGNVVSTNGYVDVQGSMFLYPEWHSGTITVANGKVYGNMNLKYDELNDKVYVKGPNNETILLNEHITGFTVNYVDGNAGALAKTFKSGFSNIPNTTAESYLEVLAEGKVELLKRVNKYIQTNKEYNSATSTKEFLENQKYYLIKGGTVIAIKKDRKSIASALPAFAAQIETYSKENSLNFKQDPDLARLISYLNTL
ncbi:hypothetical protein [Mucilaginibacter ginkgonis]|uniref:WG repeat protein n=1 Tax=Mucilaginibacter ginkgonis TaxID=2682091 RepID=A0A6I4I7Q7_9SPHI|nr:hypothetical protein [Mucilaginibacter ginkgonis]QQL49090.1 hypothetical protein GO620_013015 [Mucilaginibacter ginkgonis]